MPKRQKTFLCNLSFANPIYFTPEKEKKQPDKRYCEIFNLILEKPLSLDEIYKKSSKSVGEINHILLMLELDGYIRKTSEGYVCI